MIILFSQDKWDFLIIIFWIFFTGCSSYSRKTNMIYDEDSWVYCQFFQSGVSIAGTPVLPPSYQPLVPPYYPRTVLAYRSKLQGRGVNKNAKIICLRHRMNMIQRAVCCSDVGACFTYPWHVSNLCKKLTQMCAYTPCLRSKKIRIIWHVLRKIFQKKTLQEPPKQGSSPVV